MAKFMSHNDLWDKRGAYCYCLFTEVLIAVALNELIFTCIWTTISIPRHTWIRSYWKMTTINSLCIKLYLRSMFLVAFVNGALRVKITGSFANHLTFVEIKRQWRKVMTCWDVRRELSELLFVLHALAYLRLCLERQQPLERLSKWLVIISLISRIFRVILDILHKSS